ncbi:hypothetical protein CHISP_3235 [Chitinispirillum alkaliphilum]|nr:hypothetical protein CHISP_3235 [Chitinispirillum alkaliphilum]
MAKVFRSKSEVEQILSDYSQSELSRREFCNSKGIKLGTFQWWMKRQRENTCNAPPNDAFIKFTPPYTPASRRIEPESELTIDFCSGTRLKWRGREVPSSVYQLIAALNSEAGVER